MIAAKTVKTITLETMREGSYLSLTSFGVFSFAEWETIVENGTACFLSKDYYVFVTMTACVVRVTDVIVRVNGV